MILESFISMSKSYVFFVLTLLLNIVGRCALNLETMLDTNVL